MTLIERHNNNISSLWEFDVANRKRHKRWKNARKFTKSNILYIKLTSTIKQSFTSIFQLS